ncbi:hypothetical protein L7F22_043966 [Adiantum nelumboides]|nr:hypothetical protein [Adiantum nelumboides]
MTNSKGMAQSDPYHKSGSFSPSLKPLQGSRASFQRTRFSESSPPRQQPLRYSPSPIRALKHSEQHSAGEESDHEHDIPSGSASKAFNEMPPPKSTKRKVRLDDSIDPEGDFKRTVKARSSSFTESSPVPSTGGKNDDTILMVIKGIESLAEAKFQLCTIASKKDDLKRIAKDGWTKCLKPHKKDTMKFVRKLILAPKRWKNKKQICSQISRSL